MPQGQPNIDASFVSPPWIEREFGPVYGTGATGGRLIWTGNTQELLPMLTFKEKGGIIKRLDIILGAYASGASGVTFQLGYVSEGQTLAAAVGSGQWLSDAVGLFSGYSGLFPAAVDTWTRVPLVAPSGISGSVPGQVPAGARIFVNMGTTTTAVLAGLQGRVRCQDFITS